MAIPAASSLTHIPWSFIVLHHTHWCSLLFCWQSVCCCSDKQSHKGWGWMFFSRVVVRELQSRYGRAPFAWSEDKHKPKTPAASHQTHAEPSLSTVVSQSCDSADKQMGSYIFLSLLFWLLFSHVASGIKMETSSDCSLETQMPWVSVLHQVQGNPSISVEWSHNEWDVPAARKQSSWFWMRLAVNSFCNSWRCSSIASLLDVTSLVEARRRSSSKEHEEEETIVIVIPIQTIQKIQMETWKFWEIKYDTFRIMLVSLVSLTACTNAWSPTEQWNIVGCPATREKGSLVDNWFELTSPSRKLVGSTQ